MPPVQETRIQFWERVIDLWERVTALPEVRTALQVGQFAASLLFVVLYVWATYQAPAPFSWRSNLDLLLCATFAADYSLRFLVYLLPRYPVLGLRMLYLQLKIIGLLFGMKKVLAKAAALDYNKGTR